MSTASPPPAAAWPRSAQLALAFLLGVIATVLVARFAPFFHRARPTEQLIVGVDLNRAGKAELMQLPHVSEKRAGEIIAARERRGGFERVDDLRSVKGIGPARAAELRPWVKAAADEQYLKPAPDAEPRRGKKELPDAPIDVNRAGPEELQRLPGVGPVLAGRIIDERAKEPFRSADDLRRVSGIGPKTLAKLRPYVTVGSGP